MTAQGSENIPFRTCAQPAGPWGSLKSHTAAPIRRILRSGLLRARS